MPSRMNATTLFAALAFVVAAALPAAEGEGRRDQFRAKGHVLLS